MLGILFGDSGAMCFSCVVSATHFLFSELKVKLMTDDIKTMHKIIDELEQDPPRGVDTEILKELIAILRKMTPKEFNAWVEQKVKFTANDLQEIIDEGFYLYESELREIMDNELDKSADKMDTDLIDICAEAIVNHLYLED